MEAFPEKVRQRPQPKDIYVDISFPRYETLSQHERLSEAVRRGEYSEVYVDVDEDPPFWTGGGLSIIEEALKEAGANVVNVFYKAEDLLVQKFGEQCRQLDMSLNDASDFLAFFPTLAGSVVSWALRGELAHGRVNAGSLAAYAMQQRVSTLKEAKPYSGGRVPFIEDRLWQEIQEYLRKKQEEDRAARRQTDQLFRLGPDHAGVLIDELPPWGTGSEARPAEELKLAEDRLRSALGFQKVVVAELVSYERVVDEFRVFADPRAKGRIQFYMYPVRLEHQEPKKRKPDLNSPPVQLLDVWKNDLESKLLAMIRARAQGFTARSGHENEA